MEKILFGKEKGFFRANLHCHSVVSDGTKTPEELKEMYVKQEYSVIAFTDHDVLVPHNELTDGHFLALNGYEVEINDNTHTGPKPAICALSRLTKTILHRYAITEAPIFSEMLRNTEIL